MASSARASTTPERTHDARFDRGAAITRSLLGYGMVAGPFYLAVGVIQGLVRDGFNFARHPLSVLANGSWGGIQIANFVLTGAMVIAAAIGIARVIRPHRATSWFLGAFGASMIVAAIFRADPVDGFPPGTPEGFPTSISTPGMIHFVAGALGFTCLAVSCFCAAWAMSRRKARGLASLSLSSGLAVVLGFFGGAALSRNSAGIVGIWFSVVAGWAWLAVLSRQLYREAPDPNCEPRSA